MDEEERVTLIDFPQMVSTRHANAAELFARDVECIGRFFRKKLGYMPELDPGLASVEPDFEVRVISRGHFKQLPGFHHSSACAGTWILF